MKSLEVIRIFLPHKQYIFLGLSIVLCQICFVTFSSYAQDDYPYKDSTPNVVDVWGFYTRNCTSFAAWRMNRDHGTTSSPYYFYNTMQGPNGNNGTWGNANNWDNNAAYIGFEVNDTPVKGAIAVWEANVGGAGAYGHVAYVESVNSNGTANISEYNWNECNLFYMTSKTLENREIA